MLSGTDISAYQSSIPAGDFTVLKATEGVNWNDPRFATWWAQLGKVGALRGAYHFAHPVNDPIVEAEHFLRVVRAAGLRPGDVLVLDHETRGSSAASDAAWARVWCQHIADSVGYRPVVYTFLSFAQEGRCEGLGGYPLWIADPSRPAGQPRVPAPWSTWALHQYSEDGGVDHDVFAGDRAAWSALGGLKTPTPQQEDTMLYGTLADGASALTPISWPAGAAGAIGFLADNGRQGAAPAKLRVAVHDKGGWHVSHEVVDSKTGKTVVKFTDKASTDGVSVQREDDGTVAVAWDAS